MGLRTAGAVFAVVCIGHLLRVVTRVDLLVGGHQLPVWVNVVACVMAGVLVPGCGNSRPCGRTRLPTAKSHNSAGGLTSGTRARSG